MNFFGHAVVAAWSDKHAGHLLGSMLPDFEAMAGVPLSAVHDEDMQRGIDAHHQTDEVFHRSRSFLGLCARALRELSDAGVRRGTARAVAHIGTEMFLDGLLTREPDHVDSYLDAIRLEHNGALEWQDRGRAFSKLQARLAVWGAPRDYREPEFVLARLHDALRRRPALSIVDEESARVAGYLPALRQNVESEAPELLLEVRKGLGLGQ